LSRTVEQQAITNPVKFYDTAGNLIYEQPAIKLVKQCIEATNVLHWVRVIIKGGKNSE
jgi:hypothetical protein